MRDILYALRLLRKSPGFTTVAVLSLALGIGANAAIFSVIDSVLLRPLMYREPGQLVVVREIAGVISHLYPRLPANPRHIAEWRKECRSFAAIGAGTVRTQALSGEGEPEQSLAGLVSWNYFDVLGALPQLGRTFTPDEDEPGRNGSVILTDGLWRRRFHGDPRILGRKVLLDGSPYVVVGVLPPSFRYPKLELFGIGMPPEAAPQIFRPLGLKLEDFSWEGEFNYDVVARLSPGVSPVRALAELNVTEARIDKEFAKGQLGLRAAIDRLEDGVVGKARRGLLVLFGAVCAVLLLVCLNLANLMLARAAQRERESAIRLALGAGRGRLLRQLLTESLMLAAAGGALGTAFAWWGVRALVTLAPADLPRIDEVKLNPVVLLFTLGVSVIAGVLFGILPALRFARRDPAEALKSGGRAMTAGRRTARLREILIGGEVGVSALLLVVAGLFLGSFARLLRVDKGFQTENVITMNLTLPSAKYRRGQIENFYRQVTANVEALGGVRAAGIVSVLPLGGESWVDIIVPPGQTWGIQAPIANYRWASPGYFAAMGIALSDGRLFSESDRGRCAAVISQRTAQRIWPNETPIGKTFRRGERNDPACEVIGVVADVRHAVEKDAGPMVYVPYWVRQRGQAFLVVRTAMDPRTIVPAVRSAVWRIDPEVPIGDVRTMEQVVAGSLGQRRFQLGLVLLFAASALLVACVGIYGVVSEAVARRTNEIGIRVAMGASAAEIRRMVLRQGLAPVAAGLVVGIAGSLALGRVLNALLFGVRANDPPTLAAAAGLLALVALVACYAPARRATRIDPVTALRYE